MDDRIELMKVLSAEEAVALVRDNDVLTVSGVVQNMVPEALCAALGARYLATGSPKAIDHYHLHPFGLGPDTGLEHFAHPGMTRRIVIPAFAPPYWMKESRMVDLMNEDAIEAFIIPAGVVAANFRETAAGRPGILTKIGIDTFIDPRHGGGMITERSKQSGHHTSEVVDFAGDEYLFYPSPKVDVAFIKGTAADEDGNITFEEEATYQSATAQALAVNACGGTVIVQVKRLVPRGTLDPRHVRIPAMLVDVVIIVPDAPLFAYDTGEDSPAYSGAARVVPPPMVPAPFSAQTIIARRAAREVAAGSTINLGAGVPALHMPYVLWDDGMADRITISIEHGSLGGRTLTGKSVATHWNPTAIMDSNMTFDFYNGGGLDAAFLGMAQLDVAGNVNVALVGDLVIGVGGFMDIAQCARKVVFCGTLRQGGLEIETSEGNLSVVRDGRNAKLVEKVDAVCFAGTWGLTHDQEILYVTERAVFRLTDRGLTLVEIAPGLTVDDIRKAAAADFAVSPELCEMSADLFVP